ncbi:MAG TPA: hypothetical protein VMR92_02205 [Gemmatimonadales bacterium]|nr:hypothetical protein [Gemmatimonadales bacterium]
MMKNLALSLLVLGVTASASFAQSGKAAARYDPAAEQTYGGVVTSVISVASPDGTVGVHLNLKTATGTVVRVHLGPAVFIGMNNFSFLVDDLILVTGANVSHAGEEAVWARQVSKEGHTLVLRSADGTARWPLATADDPDGCGLSHDPVRH